MSKYIDVEALGIGIARAEIFANPEFARGWNNAIEIINNAPASDVAPVVHGRWIEKTAHDRRQYFECSNCGKQENKHTAIRGGFCWNCGAKMDKEETNELDKREG